MPSKMAISNDVVPCLHENEAISPGPPFAFATQDLRLQWPGLDSGANHNGNVAKYPVLIARKNAQILCKLMSHQSWFIASRHHDKPTKSDGYGQPLVNVVDVVVL